METRQSAQFGNKMNFAKPSVSIIMPAHNEEAIIVQNLSIVCKYMRTLESEYDWEIIIVNDGSTDNTAKLADEYAAARDNIHVFHHKENRLLGSALKTGFKHCSGDYIVTLDLDLSYSPDHIERMLSAIIETEAQVVIASPYMKGGKVSNVPFLRKFLSRAVNIFLSLVVRKNIHTFTGMVRAYERNFIGYLNLKSRDFEINPEIIYKSLILRAKIVEIPAHLDWKLQNEAGEKRVSNIRIIKGIVSGFLSGFIFRPYFYFILIGTVLLVISMYIIVWIFINTFNVYATLPQMPGPFDTRFSAAVSIVFQQRPYSFLVGGISLIISLQFLSLGFLSFQSKRYFDELFHISTNILKRTQETAEEKYDHSPFQSYLH